MIRHPFNLGIGGAVQSGYIYALERGYDVAVQVDGDGQHDPACVHALLRHLRHHPELDMVTGSRFLAADGDGYRSSVPRRMGIRIFSSILSAIVGQRVTDPTSGLRMTTRRGIELFARDYPHDYPEVEAVLLMHHHRLASMEIPVVMRHRIGGVSSINSTRSIYYMIKVLLAVVVGLFRARPVPSPATARPSPRSTGSEMDVSRLQLLAILVTAGLFVLVFELVRRRRLLERYALLWLFASVVLLGLSIWRGLLEDLASAVGIFYAPSALFAVAFGFVLILLLHFSLVISRLAEQSKVLAQRVGMLQHEVDELRSPPRRRRGGREDQPVEFTSSR